MDYKNSKIYRIVCNETGDTYIGSTTQPLHKRLSKHKESYKSFLNGKYHYVSSFKVLENNNCDIILIEEYPCENKQQLHARERYYIETCICVNMRIPNRTKKEYTEDTKDIKQEYDKIRRNGEKREEILEKKKQYHKKNKDEINRKRREKYHLSKISD